MDSGKQIICTVRQDAMDRIIFDSVKSAPKVAKIVESNEGLARDIFTSLYSSAPSFNDSHLLQRQMIETMQALPEYKELHAVTAMDDVASAIGTVQFAPGLIEKMEEIQAKVEERQNRATQQGKPSPQGLEALTDSEMSTLRQSMRRGLESAQEQADQWGDAAAAWGVEPGELEELSFQEKFALADQMTKNPNMGKITDLMGRFKNIVNSTIANSTTHGIDEVVDITLGNDLGRMLPSELVKLAESEDLFFADYLEGKLLTYELKGVEQVGKGPIVACLDVSYSMNGDREVWAKAVVLALMHLAQKQKRAFGLVTFEAKVISSQFWSAGETATIQEKIKIASIQSNGGGTDFYAPLMKAFEFIGKEQGLKPADVAILTDGEFNFNQSDLAHVLSLKGDVRIFGIGIDIDSGSSLNSFCDEVALVSGSGDIDLVKNLIGKTSAGQVKK
jgi:uncharacterized protein with von Willebrand factor type A (vWA) domain